MILITWNLNSRIKKINEQINAVLKYNPDIIAFQEVTKNSCPKIQELLYGKGYKFLVNSFEFSQEEDTLTNKKRKYGEIIASKYVLVNRDPNEFHVPWKERVLSADIITDNGAIELHTTHIPPGSTNGWIKIEMFEGIYNRLSRKSDKLRILCGDFNSPRAETNGKIITWGQKEDGGVRKDKIIRWDEGERSVIENLANFDLVDVYRKINGNKIDFSWIAQNGKGRRYDHIFASKLLNPVECRYIHEFRTEGLSDHSGLLMRTE